MKRKEIKECPGRFIQEDGQVWSEKTHKYLKQSLTNNGYLKVQIKINGKNKNFNVHRLVAEAFIENPLNLPCVNHINQNRTDNRVENLEWCDYSYNNTYKDTQRKRLDGLKKNNKRGQEYAVIQYTLSHQKVAIYPSYREAERQTGVDNTQISRCCRGINKTAGGFIWEKM